MLILNLCIVNRVRIKFRQHPRSRCYRLHVSMKIVERTAILADFFCLIY